MANAPVVISGAVDGAPAVGQLFAGLEFFVVRRVPSRNHLIADIEANGGSVVKTEKQADYLIADHLRADAPAGSYSYTFIETAIRDRALPDPRDHATGRPAGAVREVSSTIPPKGTRTPFTPEDDRILWNWVERERANGAGVKGNKMYKRLEAANPRHTFQAWRDRYVKRLIDKPPPGAHIVVAANAPPSPASSVPSGRESRERDSKKRRKVDSGDGDSTSNVASAAVTITREIEDINLLMEEASDLENVPASRLEEAWNAFAATHKHRTADEWKSFYGETVRPCYLGKRNGQSAEIIQVPDGAESTAPGPSDTSRKRKRTASQTRTSAERPSEAVTAAHTTENASQKKSIEPRRLKRLDVALSSPDLPTLADDQYDGVDSIEKENLSDDRPELQDDDEHKTGVIISSDMNNLAKQQNLLDASLPGPGPAVAVNVDEPELPTSDVNQAAELQLQNEAIRAEPNPGTDPNEVSAHGLGPQVPSHGLVSEGPNDAAIDTSGIDKEVEGQIQKEACTPKRRQRDCHGRERDDTPSSSIVAAIKESNRAEVHAIAVETAGFALTEANLAAQDAQMKPPIARGMNLPEDDEAQDRTEYARFLQQTMGVVQASPKVQDALDGEDEEESEEEEPLHITAQDTRDGLLGTHAEPGDGKLPISQEDVEDVTESNMDRPSSSQRSRVRNRDVHFDHDFHQSERSRRASIFNEDDHGTRPNIEITGRSLLSQIDQSPSQEVEDEGYGAYLGQASLAFDNQPDYQDGLNGDVEEARRYQSENEDPEGEGEESGYDEDLDLTIAEPEDGFSLEPSTGHPSQQFGRQQQHHELGFDEDAHVATIDPHDDDDVIEISSAEPPSSPIASSVRSGQDSELADHETQHGAHALETQDIFNAETQRPDFNMPLPPDSDEEDRTAGSQTLLSRSHGNTSHPSRRQLQAQEVEIKTEIDEIEEEEEVENASELDSQDQEEQLESWIATMKIRGFEESSIISALKCTTMQPELAELVLVTEKSGQAFPDDVPGVWSEADDSVLEGTNAKAIRRLDDKHGWDECQARRKYLEEWREL